jgi:AAA domain
MMNLQEIPHHCNQQIVPAAWLPYGTDVDGYKRIRLLPRSLSAAAPDDPRPYPPDWADMTRDERNAWFAEEARRYREAQKVSKPQAKDGGNGEAEPFETDEMRVRAGYEPPSEPARPPSRVTGGGSFMRAYQPISYTFDGILPSGFLYGLTAKQGSGKTALMIAGTIAVIKGDKSILGCDVEQGRVAYVTIVNPTDFRMKLAVNCFVHGLSYAEVEPLIAIIDGRDTPEQIYEGLKLDAEENGQFQLICFDTFQAGFAAANAGAFNDNEAVLAYVVRLRPLTTLPGQPSVLVAFHPTKHATDPELIPYGGGSTYNEIDGNLTFWKDNQIKLYHNRLRGPEFDQKFFYLEMLSCPEIVDKQGRQILSPVMRPTSAGKKQAAGDSNDALLKALAADPRASERDLAMAIGMTQQAVHKKLHNLEKAKFIEKGADERWRLTRKGAAEVVKLAPESEE